jgi:hypothetical protein
MEKIKRIRLDEPLPQESKKDRGRPFAPGNPGRPRGSKNRTTRLVEELLDGEAEKLTRAFIEKALAGDGRCLRYILDRLSPRRNGRPIDFKLPAINTAHDMVPAMAAIATGVNDGSLTAEEAGQLSHFVEVYVKAVDTHEVVVKLERPESRTEKKP